MGFFYTISVNKSKPDSFHVHAIPDIVTLYP
jgi:hypothetical protein